MRAWSVPVPGCVQVRFKPMVPGQPDTCVLATLPVLIFSPLMKEDTGEARWSPFG